MTRQPSTSPSVAVVGAGISGLGCAGVLRAAGVSVVVFDKARGPGGRMSTRRMEQGRFDHGAQFFTARSDAFQRTVAGWHADGIVAPWTGRFGTWSPTGWSPHEPETPRWVGAPRMSTVARHLAVGLDVRYATRITRLVRTSRGWAVYAEDGRSHGPFDLVIAACPGPQAQALFPERSPTHEAAAAMGYHPCWAGMATFDGPVDVPFDGFELEHPMLGWLARDSSKPERESGERWVVHATPAWSTEHLEDDARAIEQSMSEGLAAVVGRRPSTVTVHRWRYGRTVPSVGEPHALDLERGLGLCGDGMTRPRVEDAWRSGDTLGRALLEVPGFG